MSGMNGVLLINKPEGFTSFDVIAVLRGLTGQRKAGHTGTLDPNATGVLPVLLGNAAKAQDLIENHDKEYIAGFTLGITTDTLDIWGTQTYCGESHIEREQLENTLADFRGEIEQTPPMYSAVQKNGVRLYDLARKGIEVERDKRRVRIYELELLGFDSESQSGTLLVSCSKGTYIRTLIDDVGRGLSVGAVMTSLQRTKACGFDLERCHTLDELKSLGGREEIESLLLPVDSLFEGCPPLRVSENQSKRFKNGGALDISRTALRNTPPGDGERLRIYSADGTFLGLGKYDGESRMIKIYKLFSIQ